MDLSKLKVPEGHFGPECPICGTPMPPILASGVEAKLQQYVQQATGDTWTAEMQRALDFIPKEFVGNDAWENGVKRLADAYALAHKANIESKPTESTR